MARLPFPLAAILLVALSACSSSRGEVREGVFEKKHTRYAAPDPGSDWRRVKVEGNDFAYESTRSPHSLAVNATCEGHDDPPLDVLWRHLMMGFTEVEELERSREPMDGRESLRSHTRAKMDGVPVELLLVVLKKDDCVFDFTLLSPVGRVDEARAAFERVLTDFHAEGRS